MSGEFQRLMEVVDHYLIGGASDAEFELIFTRLYHEDIDIRQLSEDEFEMVTAIAERLDMTSAVEPDAESRSFGYETTREFREWLGPHRRASLGETR